MLDFAIGRYCEKISDMKFYDIVHLGVGHVVGGGGEDAEPATYTCLGR